MAEEPKGNVVSLGKRRADRDGTASSWTPREALVETLRLIDEEGLDPEKLIICYDGVNGCSFQSACKTSLDAIGLLQVTQMTIYMAGWDSYENN